MIIKITRSFERTRQIADFVPIKAYCEVSAEFEADESATPNFGALTKDFSAALDGIAQTEVEKTLISYRPVCIACGGKGDQVNLNKEGICGQCFNKQQMEAREFRKRNTEK